MWLDFGSDILTPRHIFQALTRGQVGGEGVVANSTAVLIQPGVVKLPKEKLCARKKLATVFGVRSIAYVRFQKDGDIFFSEVIRICFLLIENLC